MVKNSLTDDSNAIRSWNDSRNHPCHNAKPLNKTWITVPVETLCMTGGDDLLGTISHKLISKSL